MPPRTRTRATKLQKENIVVVEKKNKLTTKENGTKIKRKALADKTNSLSDTDATNTSIKAQAKVKKIPLSSVKAKSDRIEPVKVTQTNADVNSRPKRNCRVRSLKDMPTPTKSSDNLNLSGSSPFKTPSKDLETSLVVNRPKRFCRLPSKFDDHFVSPSKLLSLQPSQASTPIPQKHTKNVEIVQDSKSGKTMPTNSTKKINTSETSIGKDTQKAKSSIQKDQPKAIKVTKVNAKLSTSQNSSIEKSSPDTNNNGKKLRPKRVNTKLGIKKTSPQSKVTFAKRLLNKSTSFRVLEDHSGKGKKLDVYEFTFDPNDEPTPQKKKRKRTVRKKTVKPKSVTIPKSIYDDNITKALLNLKTKMKPLPPVQNAKPTETAQETQTNIEKVPSTKVITKPVVNFVPQSNTQDKSVIPSNETAKSLHVSNYASIRVEDIAADFELLESHNSINYSPIHSPLRPKTPERNTPTYTPHRSKTPEVITTSKDPLNLQDGSFFDDQPVASSSMNVSRVRGDPLASPWRVEFGRLPIKWHANTYVKANMTPAVECSFINTEDMAKKKHVYTNIVPDEPLPQIEDTPALKQTSIISFMREAAERSANKKKRKRSVSPTKSSYIFDDVANPGFKSPKKAKKTDSAISNEKSNENISHSSKSVSPSKAQKKDKDLTFFGFDESENLDQENVSPDIPNRRSKRVLKSRAVLKEVNVQKGPTRAVIPGKTILTSSEIVEQLYDQLKSAEDAPKFPEESTQKEKQMTNVEDPCDDNDDGQSVHLFEDIELIHHLKPHRKSYSKPKRVAFQRASNSDSDNDNVARVEDNSSDEDDLADLSFHLPNVKEKKPIKKKNKKKKQFSKKEEKEVEEWAAGFNSMCEDIDDFTLLVE